MVTVRDFAEVARGDGYIHLVTRVIIGWTSHMELDLHKFLDLVSLVSTPWVVPCAVLALLINPTSRGSWSPSLFCVSWAFCTYIESVSVLPQLLLIQNAKAKMVVPFTAHYVFALGVAKILRIRPLGATHISDGWEKRNSDGNTLVSVDSHVAACGNCSNVHLG
ncbi:hypothetical protein QQ045_012928 [Rhodiola kirilowii]